MEQSTGTNTYQQTLIYYAMADACRILGNTSAAASALRSANALQRAGLSERGELYDREKEVRGHRLLMEQFGETTVVARHLAELPSPVFIVGMPRSGTTLMEKILAQIEGVSPCGENEALGFIASQYQRDVDTGALPPPAQMNAGQWLCLAQRYFELTLERDAYLVDKMPFNFLHVGMILAMFPTARVIQMRRDPRDVCLSIYSKPFPDGHNYACEPEPLAHACSEAQRLMDHWQALDSSRVIDVQFEDLVRDPVAQSQRVTNFCGLPWSPACLEFHRNLSASFTFSEKQVREAISEKPVGQWRAFEKDLADLFAAIDRCQL